MQLSREKFVEHFWPAVKVTAMRSWWVRRKTPPTHFGHSMYEAMRISAGDFSIPSRRFCEIVEPIIIELHKADRNRKPDAGELLRRVYDALGEYQAEVTIRPPTGGHSRQIDNLHSIAGRASGLGVTCNGCGHRDHVPHWVLDRKFGSLRGNMTELNMIRFHCTSCDARWTDRKSFSVTVFNKSEEIAVFIKGGSGESGDTVKAADQDAT